MEIEGTEELIFTCMNSTEFGVDTGNYQYSDLDNLFDQISNDKNTLNNLSDILNFYEQVLQNIETFTEDGSFSYCQDDLLKFQYQLYNQIFKIIANPNQLDKSQQKDTTQYDNQAIQKIYKFITENQFDQKFSNFFDSLDQSQLDKDILQQVIDLSLKKLIIQSVFIDGDYAKRINGSMLLHQQVENQTEIVLEVIQKRKQVSKLIVNSKYFDITNIKPFQIEELNILGAFLSINPLHGKDGKRRDPEYIQHLDNSFKGVHTQGQYNAELKSQRNKIDPIFDNVEKILMGLIKNGCKDEVVNLLEKTMVQLKDRLKIQFNPMQSTSFGFPYNLLIVVFRLMGPFIDNLGAIQDKRNKLDLSIVYQQTGWLEGQTSIGQYQEQDYNKQGKNAFISYLCRVAIGLLEVNRWYIDRIYMNEIRKLNNMSQSDPKFKSALSKKFQQDIILEHPKLIGNIYKFNCYLVQAIYHDNNIQQEDDDQVIVSTVQQKGSQTFNNLPLMLFEQMQGWIECKLHLIPKFVQEYKEYITNQIELIIIIMGHEGWCSNPHLSAICLQLLQQLIPSDNPKEQQQQANFTSIFTHNNITTTFIMESLIRAFIASEKCGGANQFYDKFRYRMAFCKILSFLLTFGNEEYINQFQNLASNPQQFIQFCSFFVNDITFLFDEVLEKLEKIKKREENEHDQQFQNVEWNLKQEMDMLNVYAHFLHAYYKNLSHISQCSGDLFLCEEIRDKLVQHLNYAINILNNEQAPKRLKIQNMAMLEFKPKIITQNLVELFINYCKYDSFKQSCSQDIRSFEEEVFHRTIRLCEKHNLVDGEQLLIFEKIVKELTQQKQALQEQEEILEEDAPEEFQDQLLGTIMSEPVKLPSGYILDKSTVIKHLSNDKTDPFTRAPMKIEDVEYLTELKNKIDEFKKEKMKLLALKKSKLQNIQ